MQVKLSALWYESKFDIWAGENMNYLDIAHINFYIALPAIIKISFTDIRTFMWGQSTEDMGDTHVFSFFFFQGLQSITILEIKDLARFNSEGFEKAV